jgi:hypothetical protein
MTLRMYLQGKLGSPSILDNDGIGAVDEAAYLALREVVTHPTRCGLIYRQSVKDFVRHYDEDISGVPDNLVPLLEHFKNRIIAEIGTTTLAPCPACWVARFLRVIKRVCPCPGEQELVLHPPLVQTVAAGPSSVPRDSVSREVAKAAFVVKVPLPSSDFSKLTSRAVTTFRDGTIDVALPSMN